MQHRGPVSRSLHTPFFDRVPKDYLFRAKALIGRFLGVTITFDESMAEIMFLADSAAEARDEKKNANHDVEGLKGAAQAMAGRS